MVQALDPGNFLREESGNAKVGVGDQFLVVIVASGHPRATMLGLRRRWRFWATRMHREPDLDFVWRGISFVWSIFRNFGSGCVENVDF